MRYETSTAEPTRLWAVVADVEKWPEWLEVYEEVRRNQTGHLKLGNSAQVKQKAAGRWPVDRHRARGGSGVHVGVPTARRPDRRPPPGQCRADGRHPVDPAARAGRGEKGLLITTGSLTADATAEATRDGAPPVDLIDGPALCLLLKRYELGVTTTVRQVEHVEVDDEFFARL